MPFLSARREVFEDPAIAELSANADLLLNAVPGSKTVLGIHLSEPDTQVAALEIVRAFFASELPAVFEERFGVPPALNLSNSAIRYQAAAVSDSYIDWHMDLNFVLDDSPFLVCWTPLQDVGETRSGLEICVPRDGTSMTPLLQHWTKRFATGDKPIFDDALVEELFGKNGFRRQTLTMPAGGGAIFDQYVLHRTQRLANATGDRISIEFRMTDLNRLPLIFRESDGVFATASRDSANPALTIHLKRRDGMHVLDEDSLDRLRVRIAQ